jgi:hypothetical protein
MGTTCTLKAEPMLQKKRRIRNGLKTNNNYLLILFQLICNC